MGRKKVVNTTAVIGIRVEAEVKLWLEAQALSNGRSIHKEAGRILTAEYKRSQSRKEKSTCLTQHTPDNS